MIALPSFVKMKLFCAMAFVERKQKKIPQQKNKTRWTGNRVDDRIT
jgi:hypothetical protein